MSSAGLAARVVLSMDNTSLVGAASEGVVSLDTLKASAQGVGEAGAQMGAGLDAAKVATDGLTRSSTLAAAAIGASGEAKAGEITRLAQIATANVAATETVSALATAQSAYNATVNEARAALAAGLITQETYTAAVESATAKLAISRAMNDAGSAGLRMQAAAAASLGAGLRGFGQEAEHATENAGHLTSEVGHLGRAVGVSREEVLLLRGAFNVFPELLATIGPVGVVALALAATIGVVVVAEHSWEASTNTLRDAVSANGVAFGNTSTQILAVAHQISQTADITDKAANTMAAGFARAGINPKYWDDIANAARRYAVATGMDVAAAAEKMTSAFKDPAALLAELNDRYNILGDAQTKEAQSMVDMGDKAAAGELIMQGVSNMLLQTKASVTLLGQSWEDAKTDVSDFFTFLGQKTAAAQPWLLALPKLFSDASLGNGMPFYLAEVARLTELQKKLAQTTNDAVDGVKAQTNADSNYIAKVAGAVDPFVAKIATIDAQLKGVTAALKDQNISAADRAKGEAALTSLSKERTQALAEEAQHEEFLTAAQKKSTQSAAEFAKQMVDLNNRLREASNEQQQQGKTLQQESDNLNLSAAQRRHYNDELDRTKQLAPLVEKYNELIKNGHLDEAAAIQKSIIALGTLIDKNNELKEQTAATAELKQAYLELSGVFGKVSVQLASQVDDAKQWRNGMIAAFGGVDVASKETLDEIDAVFKSKLDQAFVESLQKARDWSSGIALAMHDVRDETTNLAKQSADATKAVSGEFETAWVDAVSGSKNALDDFFTFFLQLLAKLVYEKYLASQMNDLAGALMNGLGDMFGLSGGSSDWAGPGIGFGMHEGGVVGQDVTFSRAVPLGIFADAPRYHSGIRSVPGLHPGEVPAILQQGERVYTASQAMAVDDALSRPIMIHLPDSMAAGGAGGQMPGKLNITVKNLDGQSSRAKATQRPDGGIDVDVLVEKIDQALANRMTQGQGLLTKTVQRTFALKRSVS